MNTLTQQIPLALVLVFLQNWLKNQTWFPLITQEQTKIQSKLNHWFMILSTAVATVGIHLTLNVAQHQLIIDWPTWTVFFTGLWHWVTQYIMTKTSYHALAGQLPEVKK
jgi:hypothetical protein